MQIKGVLGSKDILAVDCCLILLKGGFPSWWLGFGASGLCYVLTKTEAQTCVSVVCV